MTHPTSQDSGLYMHNVSHSLEQSTGPLLLFNDITWHVAPRDVHIIQGVSGSGKSTFLALLAGIQKPTAGSVTCNNIVLSHTSSEALARIHNEVIGIVFQQPFLILELTVGENVAIKGHIRGHSTTTCQQESERLLSLVGLKGYHNRSIKQLSGGEQQRVAIARALYGNPAFLLLDEPTAHLDSGAKYALLQVLNDIRQQHTTGIVMTTHDQDISLPHAHVWHINNKMLQRKDDHENCS